MSYFPELHTHSKNKLDVELYLSNYATKSDFKNTTGADTSDFAKKVDLASLKSDIDKIGIYKLKKVLIGLSNLKSKVDKIDIDMLTPASLHLSKLSDIADKKSC